MLNASFVGILNGVIGDYLQQSANPLSIEMDFYFEKKPLKGNLSPVKAAYPEAKNSICIFIHGSSAAETHWFKKGKVSYSDSLYQNHQILPLHLRYNSGLHISENGELLNVMLEQLVLDESIDEINIIGHSMGGLIFKSAAYYAQQNNYEWVNKTNHVFYLGSPHHGAPLEKFGAMAQSFLRQIDTPYTKIAHQLVNIRSNGVKDLRHGYLTHEEWQAEEMDDFPINRKKPIPKLSYFTEYAIAATLSEDSASIMAHWFGDFMVQKNSAIGHHENSDFHLEFQQENILLVNNTGHIPLMYHPKVNDFILEKMKAI
jgi:pimeloyl-ACP methyl ester carboxylesterase